MRVYISGPITGTDNYMMRFAEAKLEISDRFGSDTETINPAKINANMPETFTHSDYMDISFLLLSKCDSIYMMDGWRNSKGACMEYGYAIAKGLEVYYEN